MLEFLKIKNLALIQDMELELSSGLNVLTGESGAGKSFILRALDFILGEKLQKNMVRPGKDKAQVEAIFQLPEEGELILRREFMAESARSRVYINDNLSSQEKLKQLRPQLIIHTSQHGQQNLLKPGYHAQILDEYLPSDIISKKNNTLNQIKKISADKKELEDKANDLEEKRDFLEYQFKQIEQVNPKPGEIEELESKKQSLREQAKSDESVQKCLNILDSPEYNLLDNFLELKKHLNNLSELNENFQPYVEQIEDMDQFLRDLEGSLKKQPMVSESEKELEDIEARLWELSQLQRSLNRSIEGIFNLQEEIQNNLSFLDNCRLDIQQMEKKEKELQEELTGIVEQINELRQEKSETLCQELEQELTYLGFSPEAKIRFEFSPVEIYDQIFEQKPRLMWIPNPGQPPQPLDQIASGGELSRFLLALVGLTVRSSFPTMLFDEVDAGVGGVTLEKVGNRIRELADSQQIILISHWPQLACLADKHFQVRKEIKDEETFTYCVPLQHSEIFEELARMAGGGKQGERLASQLLKGDQNEQTS